MTKIGILSDTHGLLDQRVFEHFADVDEIWHAGDIGSTEVLQLLRDFKPTRAVKGNIDYGDIQFMLRDVERWKTEEVNVMLTHIGFQHGYLTPSVQRMLQREPAQLFVCGHSHILKVMQDKTNHLMYINPGAAGLQGWQLESTALRFKIEDGELRDMEVCRIGRTVQNGQKL